MNFQEKHYKGNLYHFTKIYRAVDILNSGGLRVNTADYISFSRSPEILGNFGVSGAILVFSGEKLSQKFRLKPFVDTKFVTRWDEEAEEALQWPRGKMCPCLFALEKVIISVDPLEDPHGLHDMYGWIKETYRLCKEKGIPVKYVTVPSDRSRVKASGTPNKYDVKPNPEYSRSLKRGSPTYRVKHDIESPKPGAIEMMEHTMNLNIIMNPIQSLQERAKAGTPKFDTLEKNKKPLTPEERKKVMDAGAVWHFNGGNPSPAVWKGEDPKTGKMWYVCNTHRACQIKPTLKGAIGSFAFIKTTA